MIKNKICNLEIGTLCFFISRAFLVGVTFNLFISFTKQNSWMIPLLSIIFGVIYVLAIIYIMNYKPNLNINEKIKKVFKSKFSYLIISSIFLVCMCACIINFLNLNNFIQGQFLNNTPILAISILFSITSLYVVSKGLNTISRTSNILFYISITFIIINILGLIPNINISNVKPFFNMNLDNYTKSLNLFYAFHICPIFLLTVIPKNNINKPKLRKTLLISFIASAITIFLTIFFTITIYGYKLALLYEYPEFNIIKNISITGITSRIESILVMQWIFDFFICNIFLIYFTTYNLKSIIKFKNEKICYIFICLITIIGTLLLSKYTIYFDKYMKFIIPIIISVFATIIVSIICIKIKMSKN